MFAKIIFTIIFIGIFQSCSNSQSQNGKPITDSPLVRDEKTVILNPEGKTIEARFNAPDGFKRIAADSNSFATYLRTLPLKPHGSEVKLYDGSIKSHHIFEAVVDMDISTKDLQQCADAVMRLRGEYLFEQELYDKIHFNFTNGFQVDYTKWIEGNRLKIEGNKTSWVKRAEPSNTYADFRKYMELVFSYAGTLSLSKELVPVVVSDIQIGDVFIQGGSPGHAVIVMDVAVNDTGRKIFMLAQSFMPAQETHVLSNLSDAELNPWYSADFGSELATPEWTFRGTDLKRFP